MYYILYEGLKIESNEPVYCIVNILFYQNCFITFGHLDYLIMLLYC